MSTAQSAPAVPIMISVGEVVTFEELYAQQYTPMVRLAHTLVDTRPRAEEVVQDAFAAVYERVRPARTGRRPTSACPCSTAAGG